MRKLMIITTLLVLGVASVALAAVPLTATVTPNTPKKASEAIVTAGPFAASSSLPSALTIDFPKGFTTATTAKQMGAFRPGWADSVPVLCSTADLNADDCAADAPKSLIGKGTAELTIGGSPLLSGTATANITMYAGEPPAGGCPAEVQVTFQLQSSISLLSGQQGSTNGTLCKKNGALQLSFDQLPFASTSLPSGVTVTVTSVKLSAGASTTVSTKVTETVKKNGKKVKKTVTKKVRESLINNPTSCPSTKRWNGSFSIAFGTTTDTQPISIACTK